jgi:hypothetical protein
VPKPNHNAIPAAPHDLRANAQEQPKTSFSACEHAHDKNQNGHQSGSRKERSIYK